MIIDDATQNRQFFASVPSAAQKSLTLLTGWYPERNSERRAELDECLRRNLDCPHIAAVHLFIEDAVAPRPPQHPKVTVLTRGLRTTFAAYFEYANRRGGRYIIANSDIYFDATLGLLAGKSLRNHLICLSRWDIQSDGSAVLFDNALSQDAWIFDSPLALRTHKLHFTLGKLGADGRIACVANQQRLVTSNPARSIRAHHLHLSGVRHYSSYDRIHSRYQAVPATELR